MRYVDLSMNGWDSGQRVRNLPFKAVSISEWVSGLQTICLYPESEVPQWEGSIGNFCLLLQSAHFPKADSVMHYTNNMLTAAWSKIVKPALISLVKFQS